MKGYFGKKVDKLSSNALNNVIDNCAITLFLYI
jgi:hypothetical protein